MPAPAPWASARQARGWRGICRSPETVRPSSRSIVRLSVWSEGMLAGSPRSQCTACSLSRTSGTRASLLEVREQQVIVGALRVRDDVLRRQAEERVTDLLRRRGRVALQVQGGYAGDVRR